MGDIRTLAITDHHHVEAYAEAVDLAAALGVTLIPAIELDCKAGERRVDLLGYWIQPDAPVLTAFLERWPLAIRHLLQDAAALARLATALGAPLEREDLLAASAPREPSLYDLFVVLVQKRWAPTLGAAFQRWEALRREGHFPRLDRPFPSVEEGATVIRATGGVVSLAHPALVRNGTVCDDATVRRLITDGVVDAIETPYGGYWTNGAEKNAQHQRLAEEHGLPTSAGSDYHAYPFSTVQLGMDVPHGTAERLRGKVPLYSR